MRKSLLMGAAMAVAFAANTAKADVFTSATVDLDKDIRVLELVAKVKLVGLFALIVNLPEKAAESEALFNQRNNRNEACENCAEKVDSIVGSVNNNTGVTTVNQASGNMNNQGIAIAFAFAPNGAGDSFADAQAAGTQFMQANLVDTVNIPFRDARITNSINGNSGITAVNQAAGNINNQATAISVAAAGGADGVALSEAVLGQVNTGNTVLENNVVKNTVISGSIIGNTGIVGVNQAAGNMANQSNVVAISAAF